MTVGDHQYALSIAVATARAAERELDCRDVCGYCRAGLKPVRQAPGKWLHAREELTGVELVCRASAIWERSAAVRGYMTP